MTGETPTASLTRTLRGFGWIFAWRMATRLLGTISTVVLVRILAPADFGLVALSSTFLQAIDALSALGVEDAVVRSHHADRDLYDTAFTMIVLRSGIMAAAMALGAAPLAAFFGEPRLAPVVLVTAAITMLGGFENVRVLEFRREMKFDREFALQMLPRLAGVATAVTIAVLFHDYWALVAGTAVQRIIRLPMTYAMRPYRPRITLTAWRALTGFSVWTWMWNMVGVGRERTQTFIIGRLLGTAPLGVFVVAQDFGAMPSTELVLPMGRALYSALAITRRDGGDGEAIWLRIVGIIAIIAFPAAVGFALVAEPVVLLVLGPQWSAAVPLLQIISVAYALSLFTECCHVQFDSYGLVALDFRAMLATSAFRIVAALIFIPRYGLLGAAAGLLISMMIEQVVYLSIKKFVLPFSWLALLRQIWRPTLAAAGMAAVLLGIGLVHLPPDADSVVAAYRLAVAVCLGATVYPSFILLFWLAAGRPDGVETDLIGKLKERLHRIRPHAPSRVA